MALKGTYNFRGVEFANAYAKVLSVTGGKLFNWTGQVAVYATETDANLGLQPMEQLSIMANYVDGQDALVTVYTKLLTQPQFAEMVSDEAGKRLSKLEFMQRFTAAERQKILTAAKSVVAIEDLWTQMTAAQFIDVTRADTIGGVTMLESIPDGQGGYLLASGRAAEILTVA